MLTNELYDKLLETIEICRVHYQRMNFAHQNVKQYFPLNQSSFGSVTEMEMALFDQLVYRFSKLQDNMGSRLFLQLLEALEEDTEGLPFIDILNKMEKINLLENTKDWIKLRQLRNNIAHEYPFYKEVQIRELNLLPEQIIRLEQIWKQMEAYTLKLLEQYRP